MNTIHPRYVKSNIRTKSINLALLVDQQQGHVAVKIPLQQFQKISLQWITGVVV